MITSRSLQPQQEPEKWRQAPQNTQPSIPEKRKVKVAHAQETPFGSVRTRLSFFIVDAATGEILHKEEHTASVLNNEARRFTGAKLAALRDKARADGYEVIECPI